MILIFAAIFAYFVVMEENKCFAKTAYPSPLPFFVAGQILFGTVIKGIQELTCTTKTLKNKITKNFFSTSSSH